jgi:metal iron transporter
LGYEAKYPKYRIPIHCGLWALYILAEIAIIATDLAELLGSAIALNLYVPHIALLDTGREQDVIARSRGSRSSLFPKLPLYGGVLVTAVDVLIVLAFFNSSKGRQGMMLFEILIVSLVSLNMQLNGKDFLLTACPGFDGICQLHGLAQAHQPQLGGCFPRFCAL